MVGLLVGIFGFDFPETMDASEFVESVLLCGFKGIFSLCVGTDGADEFVFGGWPVGIGGAPDGTGGAAEGADGLLKDRRLLAEGADGVVGGGIAGTDGAAGEKLEEFLFGLPAGIAGREGALGGALAAFPPEDETCFNFGTPAAKMSPN